MSWFNHWLALNLVCNNDIFLIVSRFSVAFLDFFAKAQEARELIKNLELNLFVSRDRLSHRTKLSYLGEHSEVSQARSLHAC